MLARVSNRQAAPLRVEGRAGRKPDDLLFAKKDHAWRELQKLVGLAVVKQAVTALVDSVQQNYGRELCRRTAHWVFVEQSPPGSAMPRQLGSTADTYYAEDPMAGKASMPQLAGSRVRRPIGTAPMG